MVMIFRDYLSPKLLGMNLFGGSFKSLALVKGGRVLVIGNNGFCQLLIGGNMPTISGVD